MKKGTHFNDYLQKSWVKYGEQCFVYDIVERCDKSKLLIREEVWIKKLNSHISENGYNMCRKPRASRLGCKSRQSTIEKMRKSLRGMVPWNKGKKMSTKWLREHKDSIRSPRPNSGLKKKFLVINPHGEQIEIVGLRKFCRENGLKHTTFWRMVVGKQKEYKGWKSTNYTKI